MTRLRDGQPKDRGSIPGTGKRFALLESPALESTQLAVQWVPQQACECDQSNPSKARSGMSGAVPPLCGLERDRFTFAFSRNCPINQVTHWPLGVTFLNHFKNEIIVDSNLSIKSVTTSQKTYSFSITSAGRVMLFMETFALFRRIRKIAKSEY